MDNIESFKSHVRISDVVGKTVRLKRVGQEHLGLCPFHKEKTPSFRVYDRDCKAHCFGCGWDGDAIDFVSQQNGLDFRESVLAIADMTGAEPPAFSSHENKFTQLYDVNEAACVWFQESLSGKGGEQARGYLEGRGIGFDLIKSLRIGYAPAGRWAMANDLTKIGYSKDIQVEAGLAVKLDQGGVIVRFRDRITFPVMDRRGRVVGFSARDLSGQARAKYLNTSATPIFDKGRLLYGMDKVKRGSAVALVEGATDRVAFAKAGVDFAVATLGTACTAHQLGDLWSIHDEPIICLDGDAAGMKAGRRLIDVAMPLIRPGKSLRFVCMPAGADPDSIVANQGGKALTYLIETPIALMDFLWKFECKNAGDLSQPHIKAALRSRLEDAISPIVDASMHKAFWKDISDRWWRFLSGKSSQPTSVSLPMDMGEAAVLGVVLACPDILNAVDEELESMSFADARLNPCRAAIADWSMNDMGDVIGLREHLIVSGYASLLPAIEITPAFNKLRETDDNAQVMDAWGSAVALVSERAEKRFVMESLQEALDADDDDRVMVLLARKSEIDRAAA